jgi:hypothetical protein
LRKKFSQEQYDQDDAPAKKAVQKFLFKKWKSISINGEQYDVDLKCFRDGKIVTYVEVERRHNWKRDFEWQTIHVPERKRKFFVLDKPTYIFSVRSDLRKAYWTHGDNVLAAPTIIMDNKECKQEEFFDVPLDKWTLQHGDLIQPPCSLGRIVLGSNDGIHRGNGVGSHRPGVPTDHIVDLHWGNP